MPLEEFYNNSKGGKLAICKRCKLIQNKDYRKRNIEKVRAQNIERNKSPERKKITKDWRKTDDGKVSVAKSIDKWFFNNKKARTCHTAVNNAKRDGKLIKQPCEICGANYVHAHHCDYNKPLDVLWLCPKHHKEWHKNNEPIL